MATFARQTGAFVIAEGIEDERVMELIRTLHHEGVRTARIDGAQGFFLGVPAPVRVPEPTA